MEAATKTISTTIAGSSIQTYKYGSKLKFSSTNSKRDWGAHLQQSKIKSTYSEEKPKMKIMKINCIVYHFPK